MFETLLKFGLVVLVWSGVALAGAAIYFIIDTMKNWNK